jgi:hypothetical protein
MADPTPRKRRRRAGGTPVDEIHETHGCIDPQDAIWSSIRELKRFGREELRSSLMKNGNHGISNDAIGSYLSRLQNGGYIEHVDTVLQRGFAGCHVYELVSDTGREAPRLREDGSQSTQGNCNENLWRAMKILKSFTYQELLLGANTDTVTIQARTAKTYLARLHQAGYLLLIAKGGPAKPARYRLLPSMNTGPRPPMVQRTHRVYDPNLKKIMWSEN